MTSLAYGLDVPYEVQLEHPETSANLMTILEPQRSPGQSVNRHLLDPGVYMVSLTYNGSQSATLRHIDGTVANSVEVPAGTAGAPRTSAPMKISVQGADEYLVVAASAETGGDARATISVIPAATFDEMAESVQGVSVLSEISNLKTTKADKSTLDARVPANASLRLDTSVGTRVFAGNTMIYGDTGWRDMSSYLMPGLVVSSSLGRVRMRRVGSRIEFDIKVDVSESGLTLILDRVPIGFRAISNFPMDNGIFTHTAVGGGASQLKAGTHAGVFYSTEQPLRTGASTPFPNPGTVAWSGSYPTNDLWPTSLPGI